ncbi:Dyp-type peroxidase [Streptomyces sp. NBC_00237]|uniref:Dyp-type peroxidase n=1 Tax=Streptomyces sp. NBC_00237 TaxID=2975687 RepID=UPI002252DE7F|nr:Dyp-type peroxidase [Streptomyces sp. NBC_00237]MCX5204545.1 Dyp-type peroxidase [Streptomyces sp. NBC_00237]
MRSELPAPSSPTRRQHGITGAQPPHVTVLGFDLDPGRRGPAGARRLRRVLAAWTALSRTAASPADTISPSAGQPGGVTVTVGIGPRTPGLLGLRQPALLRELPSFPGDLLQPERSGGDLLVQICGGGVAEVAATARSLTALADGTLRARWTQNGHLPPHGARETPRNLFGFKDGTVNPTPEEAERWVWVGSGPDKDGTYLVMRRIHMDTTTFSALPTRRQEAVVGRTLAEGAPLGHREEHREVNLFEKTPEGRYVLPIDAHVRQAHSRLDGGARMLRRGYTYDDGPRDRGLLFLACMNDPRLFVRVQERLAVKDALSRFIQHRASALVYVLPGPEPTGSLGDSLF